MMRIYLAGPIFNPEQLGVIQYLKETAEAHEHEVFSPYHNSQGIWAGRAPKDCSPSERAQVLEDNIKHLYWCDVLLCWVGGMGGFTDPGVVWEMGCAYSEGKFQLAYIDEAMDSERQNMNLMLAGTIDAVCRSWVEINAALGALAEPDMGTVSVRTMFPTSVLGQEAEPIV